MITFTEVSTYPEQCVNQQAIENAVALRFEQRQRSRLRVTVEHGPLSGQDAGIRLARGTVLTHNMSLTDQLGHQLRILAADESLLIARANDLQTLTVMAYHLGNRHVPVQIGTDYLKLATDPVLADMLTRLGATLTEQTCPFEPESGAYQQNSGGHHHGHGLDHAHGEQLHGDQPHSDRNHAPRIHDLTDKS